MRLLRLHQHGELVLLNPAQILIVFPRENAAGTVIRFSGSDWLYVDENLETIDRQISLS